MFYYRSGNMSFTKCNYAGCSNVIRRSTCKFYTFPAGDKERCEKWILASGNAKLLGKYTTMVCDLL